MIKKIVLTPKDCEKLIPHKPYLDPEKILKFRETRTRILKRDGKKYTIFDSIPIILVEPDRYTNGYYILNGMHRVITAIYKKYNLDVIIISTENELEYNVPEKCHGEILNKLKESLIFRYKYIANCRANNINTMKDLLPLYISIINKNNGFGKDKKII